LSKVSAQTFAVAGALVTFVACAQIAGIDDPLPPHTTPDGDRTDSGAIELADGLSISPESVALTTSCTGAGEEKYLTLTNDSATDAPYELQVPDGSAFTLRDDKGNVSATLKGTLPAHQLLLVYLKVTATKAGTFNGQVIVRIGERVSQLPVAVTVNGGSLAFLPSLVDFGDVRKDTISGIQTVDITNTGTEPVNVIGFHTAGGTAPPGEFDLNLGAGSVNIPAGGKATASITMRAGPAGNAVTETLEPDTQTPMCGAVPSLTLKGQRVNQDVTVSPVSLDFGTVDCTAVGGVTRTVTISNFGGTDVPFTTSTPANSWFTVSPGGTVPRKTGPNAGVANVIVTLKPVGGAIGDHTDAISIAVAGPQPKVTTITAAVKSEGAILTVQPTTLDGFAPNQTRSFTIRNDGNKSIYVRNTSSNPGAFSIVNNSDSFWVTGELPIPMSVSVKFVAQAQGQHTSTITTTRGTPLLGDSAQLCASPAVVTATASR
jgi:hypothetical protein